MRRSAICRLRWRLLAFLAAMVLIAVALDIRLRPLIREVAVSEAEVRLSAAMSEAVEVAMSEVGTPLMTVQRDGTGAVLSVETDAAAVNRLNAVIGTALNDMLAKKERAALELPLGNVLGSSFLMGRGPRLTVRIDQSGAADIQVNSVFQSAGINQTVHRVELTLTVRAVVLAVGMSEPIVNTGTYLISETVIVGSVPDTFAQITR